MCSDFDEILTEIPQICQRTFCYGQFFLYRTVKKLVNKM
jgi:hypothetical protein